MQPRPSQQKRNHGEIQEEEYAEEEEKEEEEEEEEDEEEDAAESGIDAHDCTSQLVCASPSING